MLYKLLQICQNEITHLKETFLQYSLTHHIHWLKTGDFLSQQSKSIGIAPLHYQVQFYIDLIFVTSHSQSNASLSYFIDIKDFPLRKCLPTTLKINSKLRKMCPKLSCYL